MKAIDLFAGWGGFTEGAQHAGVDVVWAANHWPLAVQAHQMNHPATEHVCQDLRQADWTAVPTYDLMLASPACQGHSEASQPRRNKTHDALRATAWAVVDCADYTEPSALIVENVPAFRRWRLYSHWVGALQGLGYHLQEMVLTASEHGVPQRRDRLFIVGTREPAHLELACEPEPPFGPCLENTDEGWRSIRSASDNVRVRIAKGRRNHGRTFLTQHVTGHPGVGLDEPIRTITTKDQWALVDGAYYRPLTVRENARAMGFRDDYAWPETATRREQITGLGNAVPPPLATRLIQEVAQHV
jgi:DNA (cytosine-5)-methyltransferase 1